MGIEPDMGVLRPASTKAAHSAVLPTRQNPAFQPNTERQLAQHRADSGAFLRRCDSRIQRHIQPWLELLVPKPGRAHPVAGRKRVQSSLCSCRWNVDMVL